MSDTVDTIIQERARARKRGRPVGTTNGVRNTPRWEPQRWKPLYDQIIGLYLANYTQTMIAQHLNISSVMVGNIINCTRGQQLIEQSTSRFREECLNKIPDQINAMAIQAMQNMGDILKDPEVKAKSPIALFDRSMQVLQSAGKLLRPVDGAKTQNVQNNFFVSPEQANTFLRGIKVSEQYEQEGDIKQIPSST